MVCFCTCRILIVSSYLTGDCRLGERVWLSEKVAHYYFLQVSSRNGGNWRLSPCCCCCLFVCLFVCLFSIEGNLKGGAVIPWCHSSLMSLFLRLPESYQHHGQHRFSVQGAGLSFSSVFHTTYWPLPYFNQKVQEDIIWIRRLQGDSYVGHKPSIYSHLQGEVIDFMENSESKKNSFLKETVEVQRLPCLFALRASPRSLSLDWSRTHWEMI